MVHALLMPESSLKWSLKSVDFPRKCCEQTLLTPLTFHFSKTILIIQENCKHFIYLLRLQIFFHTHLSVLVHHPCSKHLYSYYNQGTCCFTIVNFILYLQAVCNFCMSHCNSITHVTIWNGKEHFYWNSLPSYLFYTDKVI